MAKPALKAGRLKAVGGESPSPRWEEDALGFLIAPVARDEFLTRYYEREALINIRNEPDRYAELLTLGTLDQFIASADLREGMVDVTNHRNRISRDAYVDENGRVSRVAVAEEYLRGATIILPQLHDSMFNLSEFCRALEEVFSCHMQTNIYLTPPSVDGTGNQGFPPHYDNHDVFVMQISGAKAWRLYGVPVETPFRGEQFELGRHEAGPVTQEFTLSAGDCVYIPRGLMHDAENVGDAPSLHITAGLITKTWADLLLESISELALTSPDFRRSLPAGFANRGFDREAARVQFDKLAQLIGAEASMDGAFDLLADNFLRGRRANVAGIISASIAAPHDSDRYRRRRFVPWNVADDEGKLVLVGPGGDLEFKADDGDALDVALSGAPFTAADLACGEPQELIRTLWAGGYLERVPS
ncbi:MAG TPA: cupin domain-containing protein [Allosphingosinicella sp.]|nr:cupin domain-containing protein [Allosphingosinicella sp.]